MLKKIFESFLSLTVFLLIAVSVVLSWLLFQNFESMMNTELREEMRFLKEGYELSGMEYIQNINTDSRLTVVDKDGKVLYDSVGSEKKMENHGDRPEITDAHDKGYGTDKRKSDTLGINTYYYAVQSKNGDILRLSRDRGGVFSLLFSVLRPLLLLFAVLFIVTVWMSDRLAKRIVEPLNVLDPEEIATADVYDELSPFIRKIRNQRAFIEEKARTEQRKAEEFSIITENMDEGLLVLDSDRKIMAYNKKAKAFFGGLEQDAYLFRYDRGEDLKNALDQALEGKHQRFLRKNKGVFQVSVNPVRFKDHLAGIVLLVSDITERYENETMRREFTANISHEIKTPLTSIMGYTEMMKEDLIKEEDMKDVAGRVFDESVRLSELFTEILQLSALEEEKELMFESVDIGKLVDDILGRYKHSIKEKNLLIQKTGSAVLETDPRILDEILKNIIENAVKYNKENGKIFIEIFEDDENCHIVIEDTGIGMGEETQRRVYERFYREDSGRSKNIPGSGLGLSIVKHGVRRLGGEIRLKSKKDKGSKFILQLPKK